MPPVDDQRPRVYLESLPASRCNESDTEKYEEDVRDVGLKRRDRSFLTSSKTSPAPWKSALRYLDDCGCQTPPTITSTKNDANKQEFQTIQSHLSQRRRHSMVDVIRRSPGAMTSPKKRTLSNHSTRTARVLFDSVEVPVVSLDADQSQQQQTWFPRSKAKGKNMDLKAPRNNRNPNKIESLKPPPSPRRSSARGSPRSVIKTPNTPTKRVKEQHKLLERVAASNRESRRSRPRKKVSNGSGDSLPTLVDYYSQSEASLFSGSGEVSVGDSTDSEGLLSPTFVLTRRGSSKERWGSEDCNRDTQSPVMPTNHKRPSRSNKPVKTEPLLERKLEHRSMSYTARRESSPAPTSPRRKTSLDSSSLRKQTNSRKSEPDSSKSPRKPRRKGSANDISSPRRSSSPGRNRGKSSLSSPEGSNVSVDMTGSLRNVAMPNQPPLTCSPGKPKKKNRNETNEVSVIQKRFCSKVSELTASKANSIKTKEVSTIFDQAFFSRSHPRALAGHQRLTWTRSPGDKFSDWVLICKTEASQDVFHIHKCVVGLGSRASTFLHEQFKSIDTNPMSENVTSLVLKPQAALLVPAILDYMYKLKPLNIETTKATALRQLSIVFGIDALFQAVNAFIKADMDVSTVAIYRKDALELQDEQLMRAAARLTEKISESTS